MLRSAVGKTHVLRSRLVMDYTTSYFTQKSTISTLAVKLSVSAIFYPIYIVYIKYFESFEYPWVTATLGLFLIPLSQLFLSQSDTIFFISLISTGARLV